MAVDGNRLEETSFYSVDLILGIIRYCYLFSFPCMIEKIEISMETFCTMVTLVTNRFNSRVNSDKLQRLQKHTENFERLTFFYNESFKIGSNENAN